MKTVFRWARFPLCVAVVRPCFCRRRRLDTFEHSMMTVKKHTRILLVLIAVRTCAAEQKAALTCDVACHRRWQRRIRGRRAVRRTSRPLSSSSKGVDAGGTSTLGGVNNWEPGMGGTGVPSIVSISVCGQIPGVAGVYRFDRHLPGACQEKYTFLGGMIETDPARLLRPHPAPPRPRHGQRGVVPRTLPRRDLRADAMAETMLAMLNETGRRVLLNTAFCERHADGMASAVSLSDGTVVRAKTSSTLRTPRSAPNSLRTDDRTRPPCRLQRARRTTGAAHASQRRHPVALRRSRKMSLT